jgi:membrane protease YdiL (CAAX protease family)
VSEPDLVAGRHALWTWIVVAILVTALVQIDITLVAIGHLGSALIAVVFLYAPMIVGRRRGEDLVDFGFVAAPIKKGLVLAGLAILIIFPIFIVGYFAFYEVGCEQPFIRDLVPGGMCAKYIGLDRVHAPELTWSLAEFCAVQVVVVALPEELFFRGFLLGLLERRFPPKRRILGGGIGLALVISAAAFAIIHLPKDGDPRALATFFPGLLFGWMRSATGSIMASTIAHASSNILIRFLDLAAQR